MVREQKNGGVAHNAPIRDYINKCPRARGIAVFTRGLNLDLTKIHQGQLSTAQWPSNPKRVEVGYCMIVYHRTGPGRQYPATIYTGRITNIIPLGNGLYRYEVDGVRATHIQGINWVQFTGSQSRVRYFP